MATAGRHDAWPAGTAYDAYMGRWSRQIAPLFLDWLNPADGLTWLDVGCGTGALTSAILARCNPARVLGIDPSEGLVASAQGLISDNRVEFRIGDAQELTVENASTDYVVSGLMLNFVPDKIKALSEMTRAARTGGTIGFYVWDYPGGGIELMRLFWNAAAALDPAAKDLTEAKRFPFCTPDGLAALAKSAGIARTEIMTFEAPTRFRDFDDYWQPFTLGAGPAPGYCASLAPAARERLKSELAKTLPRAADGSIVLKSRAFGIKYTAG